MSKVWVLIIGVLEVNPELEYIHAQRGRTQKALFGRVFKIIDKDWFNIQLSLHAVVA